MNKQKWTYLLISVALIGITATALLRIKNNQRLGQPGIKTTTIPGSKRLNVYLPEKVLNYTANMQTTDKSLLDNLPSDTSFASCKYVGPDSNWVLAYIVLMGADRTSIHKPEFCLTGSGWSISDAKSSSDTVRLESPHPYDLPVKKLVASRTVQFEGQASPVAVTGIYVYWFVADHELTESHWTRMGRMSFHLLATGELQRWAYVSYFAICLPGDEARTYDRMKKCIAASVPQFQLATGARAAGTVPPQTSLP